MSTIASYIIERDTEFLNFYKAKFPFFHLSNVFFRDLHYGVMAYLDTNKIRASYPDAEAATARLAEHFEEKDIFRRIDERTWLLLYPEFKAVGKPKPAAPAKPAAARPAQPKPAAAPAPQQAAAELKPSGSPENPKPAAEKKNDASPTAS